MSRKIIACRRCGLHAALSHQSLRECVKALRQELADARGALRRPAAEAMTGPVHQILCMGGERISLLGPWIDGQGEHGHAILRVQDGEIHAGAMMSPSDLRALAARLTQAAVDLDGGAVPSRGETPP